MAKVDSNEVRLTDTGADQLEIVLRHDRPPISRRVSLDAAAFSHRPLHQALQDMKRVGWRHSLALPPAVSCLQEEAGDCASSAAFYEVNGTILNANATHECTTFLYLKLSYCMFAIPAVNLG